MLLLIRARGLCTNSLLFLIIFFSITNARTQTKSNKRCLQQIPEVQPPRFLHVGGREHPLTIGSSLRPGHKLLSHIFKIFLHEALGYSRVEIIEQDDFYNATIALKELHSPINPFNPTSFNEDWDDTPLTMINIEVPFPPNLDIHMQYALGLSDISDAGNLGPVARFGWFMPEQVMTYSKGLQQYPSMDNWRIFTKPEWASIFEQDISQLATFMKDPDTAEFYCNKSYCINGIHTPDQCQASRGMVKSCAVLISGYPDKTDFVMQQIAVLKLYVKVIWVGPNVKFLMDKLTNESFLKLNSSSTPKKIPLALSWHPSTLTATGRYTSISFPACDPDDTLWECDRLALHRLVKVAWSRLEQRFMKAGSGGKVCVGGSAAYNAIHRLHMPIHAYEDLLVRYSKAGNKVDFDELACTWLQDHANITKPFSWHLWIPPDTTKRDTITIGGIFPNGSPGELGAYDVYTDKGISIAAQIAADAVNADSTVLRDYSLNLVSFNGQCKADTVMKSFIEYMRTMEDYQKLAGILGPACSDTVEPLAGVSRHFRTVIISYSAEGSSFSDRNKYPYFFRTIGENKEYRNVYLQLLKELKWKQVAALTEDGQKYTEYISHLQDLLQTNGIEFKANRKFPRDKDTLDMKQYLTEFNDKKAKIIIADVHDDIARAVMCQAHHMKMTGHHGYVWFLPLWLSRNWYDADFHNKHNNETINCTTAEMVEAINGHLSIAHSFFANDDELMQEKIKVGEWREKYTNISRLLGISTSNYAGYAYDAVWTYAYALDKLLRVNESYIADLHSENATKAFVKHIESTNFSGVSGQISFNTGPSRISLINVVQWIDNETHVVGTYYPDMFGNKTGGTLKLNVSAIRWMTNDGSIPHDGSEPPSICFVSPVADFFNVSCEIAIVILNLFGFGILGIILMSTFLIMKRRYERMTEKYMRSMGIDLLPNTSFTSLDKWEIAREHVVINRKLGEGAFGTVYGGEANFPEKGWVAVAVKTLKVGSCTEVKLDFLSEAEVMKRLDHQNIVKLLGVVTKSEPVYTVMEFMLYGDLKTFLLARRHLVSNQEECDEISGKKLTNMALDVARALTYLADLKYVHRDVACRNCMVNANRVVKLGDFGMTRAMYENDYYKFNRKGMLPVRWMAPESLAFGKFTPKSDVWSYGVLLYEIITFGSFPFQGMSNSQVLEFVKNGNCLSIPAGVKAQLEDLLRSCWSIDGVKRRSASEIVELLANNPRLITPCLDVPLSSVQMEDTGELEFQLPEKSRKCSVTLDKTTAWHNKSGGGNNHAATTPNSPTTIEPATKLIRSATTQDMMQTTNSANRHASTSSSPDTEPLLSTSPNGGGTNDVDLIRGASHIKENGGPRNYHDNDNEQTTSML